MAGNANKTPKLAQKFPTRLVPLRVRQDRDRGADVGEVQQDDDATANRTPLPDL
jgi:hypothetical protein